MTRWQARRQPMAHRAPKPRLREAEIILAGVMALALGWAFVSLLWVVFA